MEATRRKCRATAKSTEKRCKKWAINGGLVCVKHGGAAPQVKAAAEFRAAKLAAHDEAERMLARAGVDADPLEHLLESLYRAAALFEVWGLMVAAIDASAEERARETGVPRGELGYFETDPEDRDELGVLSYDRMLALNKFGEAQVHPYVLEYEKALERRARFAKMCVDAGIAERMLALHRGQVQLALGAFEAALSDLKLSAAKRQEARLAYARHLRAA